MRCPAEAEILAFVSRSMSTGAAAALEVHLADCAECRRLVFAMVPDDDPDDDRGADGSSHGDEGRIGRFEIVGRVGRGAMGDVYRALDPALGRHVAIKVRRGHGPFDGDGETRLRREAQALARLTHPNVVAVYEAGRHGTGTFIAMEHVDGVALDVWLATPRPPREVLEILSGAGRGLAAAHAVGLVHRDVKPQNVFVSTTGLAKVGDFGLVRVEHETAADPADHGRTAAALELTMTLSLTGSLVGTPAYMSPEQLRGKAATEASDQFSFCVTLYESLYGRRPFTGHTVDELLTAIAHGPALPALPRVPSRARRVLARGLRVDPTQRFASMTALVAGLSRQAPARWFAAAGAAGIAALVAVVVTRAAAVDGADHCDAPNDRAQQIFGPERAVAIEAALIAGNQAVLPAAQTTVRLFHEYGRRWDRASRDSCRATARGAQSAPLGDRQRACLERRLQRAEDLGLVLSTVQASLLATATQAVEALPDVESCVRTDGGAADRDPPPPGQAAAVADLERRVDRIVDLQETGQAAVAAPQIDAVVAAVRATGYSPLLARSLFTQATIYDALDRFTEVEPLLDEAAGEAARARDDELVARVWTKRVNVVAEGLGHVDDARRWVPVAEAAVARAGNPLLVRAQLHSHVGALRMERGEYAQARAELEAGLALAERAGPNNIAARTKAHNDLALVLLRQEHRTEARSHLETALALMREAYGDLHPDVVVALNNLGAVLHRFDPRGALAYLEQGRALGEKLHGATSVSVATSLNNMGLAHYKLGDRQAAAREFREAYTIDSARLGPTHPRLAFALGNLGQCLIDLGDYPGAVDAYRRAVEILAATMGPNDVMLARARSGYGNALQRAGDAKGAMASDQAALAGFQASEEADGEDATTLRIELAQLLATAGDITAARDHFEHAYRSLAGIDDHRGDAVMALAGIVLCDARSRRIDRARLADLERAVAEGGDLEPEATALAAYARSVSYAALRDRAKARTLAAASRDGFAKAEMTARRDEVDRWWRTLQ